MGRARCEVGALSRTAIAVAVALAASLPLASAQEWPSKLGDSRDNLVRLHGRAEGEAGWRAVAAGLVAPPDAEQRAAAAVARLGLSSWREREAASVELLSLGTAALVPVRAALGAKDPEVRQRAQAVMERIAEAMQDQWAALGLLVERGMEPESRVVVLSVIEAGPARLREPAFILEIARHMGTPAQLVELLDRPRVFGPLREALFDRAWEDRGVRGTIAGRLAAHVEAEEPLLRHLAAVALAEVDAERAIPLLVAQLEDPSEERRARAWGTIHQVADIPGDLKLDGPRASRAESLAALRAWASALRPEALPVAAGWMCRAGVPPLPSLADATLAAVDRFDRALASCERTSEGSPRLAAWSLVRGTPWFGPKDLESTGVSWVGFAADGVEIITGDVAGTVTVWSSRRADPVMSLQMGQGPIRDVVVSKDRSQLMALGEDGGVEIAIVPVPWMPSRPLVTAVTMKAPRDPGEAAPSEAKAARRLGRRERVHAIAFADSTPLVARMRSGILDVTDALTGKLVFSVPMRRPIDPVVAFSSDGSRVASVSIDERVEVRRLDGSLVASVRPRHRPRRITLDANGARLATAAGPGAGGALEVWNLATGTSWQAPRAHPGGATSLAFGDRLLVSSDAVHSAAVRDAATGEIRSPTATNHAAPVVDLAWLDDTILASADHRGGIALWRVARDATSATHHRWLVPAGRRETDTELAAADASRLLVLRADGLYLLDTARNAAARCVARGSYSAWSLRTADDGASALLVNDGVCERVALGTGAKGSLDLGGADPRSIVSGSSGDLAWISFGGTLHRRRSGVVERVAENVDRAAPAGDGWLVVRERRRATRLAVLDAADRECATHVLGRDTKVEGLAGAHGVDRVVVALDKGRMLVIRVGQPAAPPIPIGPPSAAITSLAIRPDGAVCATGLADGSIHVWSLADR